MNAKNKTIIAAILALLGAMFGWYVAYSDGDATTVPNTTAVIDAGKDVVNAVTSGGSSATANTTATE